MFIKEVSDLMNSDRSPICGNRPEVILDPAIQKPLTHFSMMTHGFGGVAIISVLDALNAYVHETLKYLDRNFGIPTQHTLMPFHPSVGVHMPSHPSQLHGMGNTVHFQNSNVCHKQ